MFRFWTQCPVFRAAVPGLRCPVFILGKQFPVSGAAVPVLGDIMPDVQIGQYCPIMCCCYIQSANVK